jgi:hypothetical protein
LEYQKFIYLSDNHKKNEFQCPPKLFKIYPVIQYLNNVFQNLHLLNQNTATDESLTLWQGHLSFRQYIPLKAAKFGIKLFKLCEYSMDCSVFPYLYRAWHGTDKSVSECRHKDISIVTKLV